VATVDLGFHLRTTQRLRLRGIDTPELRYPAGERAREYVRHTLADVDFVVLGTARTDRYGRYLADVFYLPGEADPHVVAADGVFLNRQLIEEGLAVRYR
jgi:endonuclease YncB( thermonuclease family)